jgi:hypothetical protein
MKTVLVLILWIAVLSITIAAGWLVGYVALLAGLIVAAVRLARTARKLRPTAICSHCSFEVPLHGLFRCACGAVTAGHAFTECSICGQESAPWTACPQCGVAVSVGGGGAR